MGFIKKNSLDEIGLIARREAIPEHDTNSQVLFAVRSAMKVE